MAACYHNAHKWKWYVCMVLTHHHQNTQTFRKINTIYTKWLLCKQISQIMTDYTGTYQISFFRGRRRFFHHFRTELEAFHIVLGHCYQNQSPNFRTNECAFKLIFDKAHNAIIALFWAAILLAYFHIRLLTKWQWLECPSIN